MRGSLVFSLVGAGVAMATCLASPTHADGTDDVFIGVLDDEGIAYPSAKEAIKVAGQVCDLLGQGNSLLDATRQVANVSGMSVEDSGFFVGAATASYCPSESP
ncbi:DUF732 domain-containing protein [Mycobacterium sp. URHB0044]|jgi:hypothetical protein|uniref:DUF732 domain-containing protein n=1 Tax=Mycobacterium sp. URHB0044 TaxID=1380386 RepID=UPI00048A7D9C|nr:DUF732 domain-containing protein [Mycobacterium sp. URHB0044]